MATPKKLPKRKGNMRPLFDGAEWSFELINKAYDAMGEIALGELGLDIYPNQIEVITAEQMLDSYSSIGMPLMYRHWSFGKRFAHDEAYYKRGMRSLAYELVINSDPCINYIMEENSMTMQALVLAHAAYGHNHFFKNNYQFQLWTQPDHIIDYLAFAKTYVAECEERHGQDAVEHVLDAAHALMNQGVSRDLRPASAQRRQARAGEGRAPAGARGGHLRRHLPHAARDHEGKDHRALRVSERAAPDRPARGEPALFPREERAQARGLAARAAAHRAPAVAVLLSAAPDQDDERGLRHLRALRDHEPALRARPAHRRHHARVPALALLGDLPAHLQRSALLGLNPYALGFAMMNDIRRIATEPTAEDREWFPDFAGCGDWMETLREAWAHFRDESFVLQYLSPKLIRDFRMFAVSDDAKESAMAVKSIHDEQGYKDIRRRLARHYDVSAQDPDLQVTDADLSGSRRLVLTHRVRNGVLLDKTEAERTLAIPRPAVGLPRQARRAGRRGLLACSRSTKRCRCLDVIPAPRMPARALAGIGRDPGHGCEIIYRHSPSVLGPGLPPRACCRTLTAPG